jgi:hypothetical protein
LRSKIKALHLADLNFYFVQCDATCQVVPIMCQEEPAARGSVVSGKAGEFLVETLKAQAKTEGVSVFEKEFPHLLDLDR